MYNKDFTYLRNSRQHTAPVGSKGPQEESHPSIDFKMYSACRPQNVFSISKGLC
jgi:hypothetical protein